MDKEGQRPNTPVFQSGNIGSKATPEYFVNVKGGKKDQEKVEKKRSRISRKTLTLIFSCIAAAIIIVLTVALIANLASRPKGSRTDEEMPTTIDEVEKRTYEHLYTGDTADYPVAVTYISDLIKDMEDTNQNKDLIFCSKILRTRIAFRGGLREKAIELALALTEEADTDYQKNCAYNALSYMYNQEQNTEKRDFYMDLLKELNYNPDTEGVGGVE